MRCVNRAASPRAWLLAFCCAILSFASSAAAADSNALLNAWFAAQTNLHTWQADFVQTRVLKSISQPLKANGKIWFTAPDQFRWEVGNPAQTIALRETNQLLIVYPRLKRIERYPLDGKSLGPMRDALALVDAGFPKGRADLESHFKILAVTETKDGFSLNLQPKSPMARRFMTELEIGFRAEPFSLVSTEVVFIDGSKMRNDFTNIVMNATVPPDTYTVTPGPGFTEVNPLGK